MTMTFTNSGLCAEPTIAQVSESAYEPFVPEPGANYVSDEVYGPPAPEPDPSIGSEPVYGPPAPDPDPNVDSEPVYGSPEPDSIMDIPGNILSWIGDVYTHPQDHILVLVIICTVVLAVFGFIIFLIAKSKK